MWSNLACSSQWSVFTVIFSRSSVIRVLITQYSVRVRILELLPPVTLTKKFKLTRVQNDNQKYQNQFLSKEPSGDVKWYRILNLTNRFQDDQLKLCLIYFMTYFLNISNFIGHLISWVGSIYHSQLAGIRNSIHPYPELEFKCKF